MTSLNIKKINLAQPDKMLLATAAEILTNDGILVAPTETRYGLLGRIDRAETVEEIYRIKKRRLSNPTAVFLRSTEEISDFGYHNGISEKLANYFLPGPLTIVLKAKPDYNPPIAVNGQIGLRISSSRVIAGLLEIIDFNLTATSANISGSDEPETIESVASQLGEAVTLYLDGGPLKGLPSTVIDCSHMGYKILREGAIGANEIKQGLALN